MPDAITVATAAGPYVAMFLVGVMAGIVIPYYFAAERLRGAGRAIMSRVTPYQPPPGKDAEQAMIEATTRGSVDNTDEAADESVSDTSGDTSSEPAQAEPAK